MRLSDLQNKDVINLIDGKKVGNIIDVSIDSEGKMAELIVEKSKFFVSMFSNFSLYLYVTVYSLIP